ncbi:7843_t:CDS:2 [Funneliformis geosporum]|uniref:Porphobilinogen deaminase n=1 Tax=Funneliformis geosporum TaxID=1117311 RepID=A0A9W4SEN4_9GLOM|nr:7843_t:CDS:2 [Funneliformis geosporum]CAI2165792.1 3965_t:CDS:2 [Funneliformis geosporum]
MSSKNVNTFTIGSRKSELALIQTKQIQRLLEDSFPDHSFPITSMTTIGDKILSKPLSQIGEKSLFTKELEVALQNNIVDLVVHSLKDLPTNLPEGMTIGAILKRENPEDALVIKEGLPYKSVDELPKGSVIGTSSVRRSAQLKASYPNLALKDVRGNLNTRLTKLDDPSGPYSALILAVAGLERLGMSHRISQTFSPSVMLHAVGQGALAVECRTDDKQIIELLSVLEDKDTRLRCTAERSLLRSLEGGCSVPIGVNTRFIEAQNGARELKLLGLVARLDGSEIIKAEGQKNVDEGGIEAANELGKEVARILVEKGASSILEELKVSRQ